MSDLIYLACPYSHPHPEVRRLRFELVNEAAAKLIREGSLVFSPISHAHPIGAYGVDGDWRTWQTFDLRMIRACDRLAVLTLAGWRDSVGVAAEIDLAAAAGKPIAYLRPSALIESGNLETYRRVLSETEEGRMNDE